MQLPEMSDMPEVVRDLLAKFSDNQDENTRKLVKAGLIGLASALLLNYAWKSPGSRNPPGPRGIPLIGSLPSMRSGMQINTLKKLRQKYGDIFSMVMGRRFVIYLNGRDVIRDAFVKHSEHFSDRPNMIFFEIFNFKGKAHFYILFYE